MSLASGGALGIGRGFLAPAFAAPAEPGDSPYGPLVGPDDNGLMLPEGFTSRVVQRWYEPTEIGTLTFGTLFPDGAATFPTDDGGWILVSNSENPPPAGLPDLLGAVGLPSLGGVNAIRFAEDGAITDAYPILSGSRSNCAGGVTPWGTWLSCEEHEDPIDVALSGRVYECDPTGQNPAVHLPAMGHFQHENATVDPVRQHVYQSEDRDDGLFYRFTPTSYPDLTEGLLEAAVVADDGSVTWVEIPDPTCSGGVACRRQVTATGFAGGEGCFYDDGKVFLDTKLDDRIWVYDVATETISVLYDAADFAEPPLTGVDHLIVQPGSGNLLVAEDGGNMQAVMIDRTTFAVFPIAQVVDPLSVGLAAPEPFDVAPTVSEISGLAFNPAGDRLYFNSQRGYVGGVTYEVSGPWLEVLQPAPTTSTITTVPPTSSTAPGGGQLPATGGGLSAPWAVGAAAGSAALIALRNRLDQRMR